MKRRTLIKTGALAGIASIFPLELFGAVVSNSKQPIDKLPAGFKKINVGDIEVFILTDGFIRDKNVDHYAPRANVTELKRLLKDNFRSDEYIDMAMNVPLIKTKDRLILCDSGMGIFADDNTGKVLQSLSAAGFSPSQITDVFISHAHPDHIGGVVTKDFVPVFPNAKIHISKVEKDFWMQATIKDFQNSALKNMPDFLNQFIPTVQKLLKTIEKQTVFYDFSQPLYGNFTFVKAPGHTPGMTLVKINSNKEELLFVADLIHNDVILFPHPEWGFSGDTDLDLAVESRKKILKQLELSKTKALAYHLASPGLGFTAKNGNEFKWIPEAFFTV